MQSAIPKGITVNHNENEMLIKLRWFRPGRLPMVISTLVITIAAFTTNHLHEMLTTLK